eukprot:Trichotokara_eunicae@DN8777_c0_g1_i1.p1
MFSLTNGEGDEEGEMCGGLTSSVGVCQVGPVYDLENDDVYLHHEDMYKTCCDTNDVIGDMKCGESPVLPIIIHEDEIEKKNEINRTIYEKRKNQNKLTDNFDFKIPPSHRFDQTTTTGDESYFGYESFAEKKKKKKKKSTLR